MKKFAVMALGMCFLISSGWAGETAPPMDQKAKDSYSLGYAFARNLKLQEIEVDADLVMAAVRDALAGKDPAIAQEEINYSLQQLREKAMVLQERRFRELAAKNLEEGKSFLAANKTKEGVVTLPSGAQYKILREGTGPHPQATDTVKVNYRGALVNGTEFDSSYSKGEPPAIAVNGVIKGWAEVLPLMKTGAKWQVFVPPDLAYGERSMAASRPTASCSSMWNSCPSIAPPLPRMTSRSRTERHLHL